VSDSNGARHTSWHMLVSVLNMIILLGGFGSGVWYLSQSRSLLDSVVEKFADFKTSTNTALGLLSTQISSLPLQGYRLNSLEEQARALAAANDEQNKHIYSLERGFDNHELRINKLENPRGVPFRDSRP
jgi:hypothetical protein